jgi:polyhydroxybutyrate depolymerase
VSEGRRRTFLFHLPQDLTEPAPLLVALHGGGGAGLGIAAFSRMNVVADRHGFVVVYPDGVERSWADGRAITEADRAGVDDVRFVADLVDLLAERHPVDPGRVFAVGISNGGTMAVRLGCELTDRFAAVGVVAASMPATLVRTCAPARPVSLVLMHGTEDRLMPFGGGQVMSNRGAVIGAAATVRRWAELNGCAPEPVAVPLPATVDDGTSIVRESFAGPPGIDVELYVIEGGGHTWPGGLRFASVGQLGRTTRNLDASETIWRFFAAHGRSPA